MRKIIGMCRVNVGKSNRIKICAEQACSRNMLLKGKGHSNPLSFYVFRDAYEPSRKSIFDNDFIPISSLIQGISGKAACLKQL